MRDEGINEWKDELLLGGIGTDFSAAAGSSSSSSRNEETGAKEFSDFDKLLR